MWHVSPQWWIPLHLISLKDVTCQLHEWFGKGCHLSDLLNNIRKMVKRQLSQFPAYLLKPGLPRLAFAVFLLFGKNKLLSFYNRREHHFWKHSSGENILAKIYSHNSLLEKLIGGYRNLNFELMLEITSGLLAANWLPALDFSQASTVLHQS